MIEVFLGVLLMLILLPSLLNWFQVANEERTKKVAAMHMERITEAVKGYVKTNYAALVAGSSATNASTFSVANLVAGGFLPPGFQATNIWGQTTSSYVLQPSANNLLVITLTVGGLGDDPARPRFANVVVPAAASLVGAPGGYVPTGTVAGQNSAVLQGSGGGWQFAFAGTDVPNPGAGHLASMLYFDSGSLANDFLYRFAVPGQPDLNTMHTTLDMDGNPIRMGDANVDGVRMVDFESHTLADVDLTGFCAAGNKEGRIFFSNADGLFICRQGQARLIADSGNIGWLKDATVANDDDLIPMPTCPTGLAPQIFATPILASSNIDAYPLAAIQAWAVVSTPQNLGLGVQGAWRVKLRVYIQDAAGVQQWIYPTALYGKIQVLTKCG